ncbi:DUF4123 domain-containing protein [Thalassospira sp. TSL5-1]|uniref:DUF4123 domain-containing protein n=1 Tax=Thalassospira sp. TSL5-1 TaxID=1544451 RepID=UPI0009404CCE|nr:DUF4123 domain-containing protein [Thalassospira sp. TSL5-1]OKH87652.1 hypothetical protein LF95_12900 [Thalassospira sp. TSL5-1]
MSDFCAWIGNCQLHDRTGPPTAYICQTAIWADSEKTFHYLLEQELSARDLTIIWLEEVLPATQYLARHADQQQKIGPLARAVHAGKPVEISPLTQKKTGEATDTPASTASFLHVSQIENITPLDMQLGVHPQKTVPDTLFPILFGKVVTPDDSGGDDKSIDPAHEDIPNTFAILNAAKLPYHLTTLLEVSGLRYQSLFQGDTQDELGEHAPYLVELKADNGFTKTLFTGPDGINGLWDRELGIYLRSRTGFDDIRKHFRKFTRLRDGNNKWFYFAFWEGETIPALAQYFNDQDGRPCSLFYPGGREATFISSKNKQTVTITRSIPAAKGAEFANLAISPAVMECLSQMRQNKKISRMAEELFDLKKDAAHTEFSAFADETRQFCEIAIRDYRITTSKYLKALCLWKLVMGTELAPFDGVLRSGHSEAEKIGQIAARLKKEMAAETKG